MLTSFVGLPALRGICAGHRITFFVALLSGAGTGASAQDVLEDGSQCRADQSGAHGGCAVAAMLTPWSGDLDGRVARGFVRMGSPRSRFPSVMTARSSVASPSISAGI